MSLVHPASSYGDRKLNSLNGSNKSSALSTSTDSNKHRIMYGTESYSSKSYDPKYFLDSPTDELNPESCSSHAQGASSYQPIAVQEPFDSSYMTMRDSDAYQSNFELEYLESHIPEAIDFDGNKMRLKLQELERSLLDRNDENDDSMIGPDQSMEIDGEWADPVQNVLLHDSSKESSSFDSNIRSISSNKEVSLVSNYSPKQLLFDCAATISDGNVENASNMINELRQRVSIQGEPSQRIQHTW